MELFAGDLDGICVGGRLSPLSGRAGCRRPLHRERDSSDRPVGHRTAAERRTRDPAVHPVRTSGDGPLALRRMRLRSVRRHQTIRCAEDSTCGRRGRHHGRLRVSPLFRRVGTDPSSGRPPRTLRKDRRSRRCGRPDAPRPTVSTSTRDRGSRRRTSTPRSAKPTSSSRHAGTGSALTTLAAGRLPILIPRDHSRGEIGDGHQPLLARELDKRGIALHREPDTVTVDDLLEAAAYRVESAPSPTPSSCRSDMPGTRPFRFGVHTSDAQTGPAWATAARRYESLGFSTLLLRDHFDQQLAPIVAMTAASVRDRNVAGRLPRVRERLPPSPGARQRTRHARPAVRRTGRELGLGAGWMRAAGCDPPTVDRSAPPAGR